MLNKSTEAAIAAMSLLAEHYDEGTPLRAADVAEQRRLQRPFVAKLLTQLSQAGLIHGTPGRHGGYVLARSPQQIRLSHIAECFERRPPLEICPFGPDYCGTEPHCPLHDDILQLRESASAFLERTTLDVFRRR